MLAPRMREKFQYYYENKWELVRQRASEEFFRLEDASERQQKHMQQELNQRVQIAESQLEWHQNELVRGFTERIQQGKGELQGSRRTETRLRSERTQTTSTTQREGGKFGNYLDTGRGARECSTGEVARDEQLARELRALNSAWQQKRPKQEMRSDPAHPE